MIKDPRNLQVLVLASLLIYGKLFLDYFLTWPEIGLIFVATQCLQFLFCSYCEIRYDPKSTVISALSLALLLRFGSVEALLWACLLVVGSKFLLRRHGKHIFNPTNFALIVTPFLLQDTAWIAGSQWGSSVFFAFLLLSCGITIVTGVKRFDISFAALGMWSLVLLGRTLYYNDPLPTFYHAATNGGIILFCFFMISDPKSSPDTFKGRMIFAWGAVLVGSIIQFGFYKPHGIFYGLFVMSLLRPFLKVFYDGPAYNWTDGSTIKKSVPDGYQSRKEIA